MSERVSYIQLYSPRVSRISRRMQERDSKQLLVMQPAEGNEKLLEEGQSSSEPSPQLLRSNFFKLQYMTWCFVLLFTAFTPVYNLSTQLYQQLGYHNLGMIVLFINAIFFGCSSVIASNLVSKYPLKVVLFFGSFGYSMFVMVGIIIAYCSDRPDS